MKIAILISSFGFSLTQAVIFDCRFQNFDFEEPYAGILYSCDSTVINSGSALNIRGIHEDGKGNSDVAGLAIRSQPLNRIPRGIDKIFSNLKAIFISNSNLIFILEFTSISSQPFLQNCLRIIRK
jgi:hypothetical protein